MSGEDTAEAELWCIFESPESTPPASGPILGFLGEKKKHAWSWAKPWASSQGHVFTSSAFLSAHGQEVLVNISTACSWFTQGKPLELTLRGAGKQRAR